MNIGKLFVEVVDHPTLGKIVQIEARKVNNAFDIKDNGNLVLRISEQTIEQLLLYVADELCEWEKK